MLNEYQNATFPEPRPFQHAAHEAVRTGFKAGHKNQLIMAATGAGKTFLAHRIAHATLKNNKRVLFLCDRTALINQTSGSADQYGLSDHGILQASHPRRNDESPYQIASIQTIQKRGFFPKSDLIIIDEAHSMYKDVTEYASSTKSFVIGLSATPFTKGLGKVYSNLINAATMDELTKSGVLVPMRILSCTRTNMEGAQTVGGEWTDKAAGERGMEIIGDVVSEWLQHGENRKTIAFGSNIAHCKELCQKFMDAGVMAALYTSQTTSAERELILKEYNKPDSYIKVLISVEALAKGFDCPSVSCIIDARPLRKSLSTAIQIWGRGLRSAPAKADCLLLDFSGNIVRFMADYEQIYFNGLDKLDDGEKLEKEPRKENDKKEGNGCPACGHKPFVNRCVSCGHQKEVLSNVITLNGKMFELELGKKALKQASYANSDAELWAQIATYAKAHSTPDKQEGRAFHLYNKITGKYKDPSWTVANAPSMIPSVALAKKIRSLNIAYVKARRSA